MWHAVGQQGLTSPVRHVTCRARIVRDYMKVSSMMHDTHVGCKMKRTRHTHMVVSHPVCLVCRMICDMKDVLYA